MCLFGVIKLKFNVKPLIIPQNRQILAQNGTRGVATAWTGVDMSTPLSPEVVPEIDANPVSFYGGGVGQVRSSTRQSVPYVNFKVAVLEFAYR